MEVGSGRGPSTQSRVPPPGGLLRLLRGPRGDPRTHARPRPRPTATCPPPPPRQKKDPGRREARPHVWCWAPAEGWPRYSLSHSSSAAAGPGGPSADSAPAAAPAPAATVAAAAMARVPLLKLRPSLPSSSRRPARSGAADAAGEGWHVTGRSLLRPRPGAKAPPPCGPQGQGCRLAEMPPLSRG